jgi:hypothetical protein
MIFILSRYSYEAYLNIILELKLNTDPPLHSTGNKMNSKRITKKVRKTRAPTNTPQPDSRLISTF